MEKGDVEIGAPAPERALRKRRLRSALFISITFLLIEVAGGLLSHSLALFADAAHLFTDVAALILAYAAMTLADRAPTRQHTFGLYRAEILAAFVNAQVLLLVSGFILVEAYKRFREPPEIQTTLMLWVAVAGLAANVVSMLLLRSGQKGSLNLKAAYLEVVTDTLASVGVIGAAALMPLTGWLWLDPAISAAIGLLIFPRTISILRQSAHILLEGSPGEVDPVSLRAKILAIPGVEALHDLHVWTLTSGVYSASVHVRADSTTRRDEVLGKVQELFEQDAGVDHATIQVEWGAEQVCRTTQKHE